MSRTVISAEISHTPHILGQTEKTRKQQLIVVAFHHGSRLYIFMKTNSKNMIEKE